MKFNYWHISPECNKDSILKNGILPSKPLFHNWESDFGCKKVVYLTHKCKKDHKLYKDFVYLKEVLEPNSRMVLNISTHLLSITMEIPSMILNEKYVIFEVMFDKRKTHINARHDQSRKVSYKNRFFWNRLNTKYLHTYQSKSLLITPHSIPSDDLRLSDIEIVPLTKSEFVLMKIESPHSSSRCSNTFSS